MIRRFSVAERPNALRAVTPARKVRPSIEMLEDRTLLNSTSIVPDAYLRRVMEHTTHQLLNPTSAATTKGGVLTGQTQETRYLGQWVVGLSAGIDDQVIATRLGAAATSDVRFLANAYVYQFSNTNPGLAYSALVGQQQMGLVSYFYPLMHKRMDVDYTPNDPLFPLQWQLENTGQSGGTPGEDARAPGAWDLTFGNGVQIGIIDDGLQHTHPDLLPNRWSNPGETAGNGIDDDGNGLIDDIIGWDFNFVDNDPDPEGSPHGTAVGGIAAARGDNTLGVSGTAPLAQLAGLRLLADFFTDNTFAEAVTYKNQVIDIYNNSWGVNGTNEYIIVDPVVELAYMDTALNGRNELGGIIVRSAGNNGDLGDVNQDDVNYNAYRNSRFAIAVAGVDENGVRAFYSNEGAPIIVSAPTSSFGPGTVTTDLVGNEGYNGLPDLDYTNGFGGTSSSAPLVSGVAALILSINPNLTYRDVQQILARSARQNDVGDGDWVQNGAGLWVNHKYGFGVVNAEDAVALADTWTNVAPEQMITSGTQSPGLAIPDNNTTGVTVTATLPATLDVEWIELEVDITHTYRGDLQIELTSPDGTTSVLARQRFFEFNPDLVWKFTSYRHLGETSGGDWTITFSDRAAIDIGTLNSWKLNVFGTLRPPVGVNDFYTTAEDNQLIVSAPGVLTNDPGGVRAFRLTNPTNGNLIWSPTNNGSFRYIPNPNFNGSDSFTYEPSNGFITGNPATVFITVTPVNDAPVAVDDGLTPPKFFVRPGQSKNFPSVLLNDFDVEVSQGEGQTLTAIQATAPAKGIVSNFVPAGTFTYQANPGSFGDDVFFYTAFDGVTTSNFARVNIHINTPTDARDDKFATFVGNPLPITGNLRLNDTDFDANDTLTFSKIAGSESDPTKGTVTVNPNGTFSFTPTALFTSGVVTFRYKVFDGWEDSNEATVSIFMDRLPIAINDPPLGVQYAVVAQGVLEVFSPQGLLINDTDPDFPQPAFPPPLFFQQLQVSSYTQPANGTVTVAANGYFRYVPNPSFLGGTDTFTYRIHDNVPFLDANGNAVYPESNFATVTINVLPRPIANTDNYVTFVRQVNIPAPGILGNDFLPDPANTTIRLVSTTNDGTLGLNQDGSFSYLARSDFNGIDRFFYYLSMPNPGAPGQTIDSNVAEVTITVYSGNRPPVAMDDNYATTANIPITIAAPGVLGNDTDPDFNPLTALLVTGTSNGALVLNANGSFTYTPALGFQGVDTFTYQATDGLNVSNTATVRVTVGTPPPPPTNPARRIVEAQDSGGELKIFAGETGQSIFSLRPYGTSFTGGVRVAVGDVNGDTVPDIITSPGPQTPGGSAFGVRVFNGVNFSPMTGFAANIFPFGGTYRGGIRVAAGDVDGDGLADIITSADAVSASQQVRVINASTKTFFTNWLGGFKPYTGTAFGGVRVAVGDVTGDGNMDIIVSPGASTPTVKIYNSAALTFASALFRQFNVQASAVAGGIFVASGDLDGDGFAEVVTGSAAANTQVKIFYGNQAIPTRTLSVSGLGFSGPARVAVGDINGDGRLDLVVGLASTTASKARVYDATTLAEMFGDQNLFTFGSYKLGLNVASLGKVG